LVAVQEADVGDAVRSWRERRQPELLVAPGERQHGAVVEGCTRGGEKEPEG